jgi:hypothetical protein
MADTSQFGDLLEPGFLEIYNDAYKETERLFTTIFKSMDSEKPDEKMSGVSGFGLLTQKTQNAPIEYEDPVELYNTTFTHLTYAKGFKISKELYDDDQYNVMNGKPEQLGRAARRTEEVSAANVFNRAMNTSYTGGDAKPLCSTSHPRADGGTSQSNASATGAVFSEPNYEVAKLAMRKQVDHKGMKIDVRPRAVVVPIDLESKAKILFGSNLRSGSADNDINPYLNDVKIIPWIYMDGSATRWFLLDTDLAKLIWFWRERASFKQDTVFETDTAAFKVRERFSNGFPAWEGVWGSNGDATTYSD